MLGETIFSVITQNLCNEAPATTKNTQRVIIKYAALLLLEFLAKPAYYTDVYEIRLRFVCHTPYLFSKSPTGPRDPQSPQTPPATKKKFPKP